MKHDKTIHPNVHPVADFFPMMEGPALDALVEDVQLHGQQVPVIQHEDQLIDGRNRWRAVVLAQAPLKSEPLSKHLKGEITEDRIVHFILQRNAQRQHLSPSQKAMVAARMAKRRRGNQTRKSAGLMTQAEAARLFGISERLVQCASRVLGSGNADLIAQVDRDEVAVSAAAEIVAAAARSTDPGEDSPPPPACSPTDDKPSDDRGPPGEEESPASAPTDETPAPPRRTHHDIDALVARLATVLEDKGPSCWADGPIELPLARSWLENGPDSDGCGGVGRLPVAIWTSVVTAIQIAAGLYSQDGAMIAGELESGHLLPPKREEAAPSRPSEDDGGPGGPPSEEAPVPPTTEEAPEQAMPPQERSAAIEGPKKKSKHKPTAGRAVTCPNCEHEFRPEDP